MAVRRTAYVHASEPTPDDMSLGVTVDVYALWPEGCARQAVAMLEGALAQIREQIGA